MIRAAFRFPHRRTSRADLAQQRKERGLTVAEVAQRAGIPVRDVIRREQAECAIPGLRSRIAEVLLQSPGHRQVSGPRFSTITATFSSHGGDP